MEAVYNRSNGWEYIDLQPCCCEYGKRVLITNVLLIERIFLFNFFNFSPRFYLSLVAQRDILSTQCF